MARIVTKDLAEKMVRKLGATPIAGRNKAHDEYAVEHAGLLLGVISIRRGSEKDQGHDHIPRELNISPHQAKRLVQCPWSRGDFLQCLRDKGFLPPEGDAAP